MKKLITAILILLFTFGNAFADTSNCDWTQIKKLPNGDFDYSPALNLCVGQLVSDNKVQAQQIADYKKAISLKDLAISYDDQRVALWQKSADDELQRMNSIEKDQKESSLLSFGMGVVFTAISIYGASQLTHR